MNAIPKTEIVNPQKLPQGAEFTPELATQRTIQRFESGVRAKAYGFRLVCLADETNNQRWIDAAVRFADDNALASGVRGERNYEGVEGDYGYAAGGYAATQLDAVQRQRKAREALGAGWYDIVVRIVVQGMTARALGRWLGTSDKTAFMHGGAALEALAVHYDG